MSFRLRKPVPPRERSRRQQSLRPEDVQVPELTGTKHPKTLRSLLSTGGRNGRISAKESKTWNVFGPVKQKEFDSLIPIREFKIEEEISENDHNENTNSSNKNDSCNRLLSSEQIDELCGSCSKCEWNDAGESFACYLMESQEGKKVGRQNIIDLLGKWKKSNVKIKYTRNNNKLTLTFKQHGIATNIEYCCTNCNSVKGTIEAKKSAFVGKTYNRKQTKLPNNSWYDTNIRLVLGTLAIGSGGTDLADFLAFAGLPNFISFCSG